MSLIVTVTGLYIDFFMIPDSEKFVTDIGHSTNYDISDVFWVCSNVFAKW